MIKIIMIKINVLLFSAIKKKKSIFFSIGAQGKEYTFVSISMVAHFMV